MQKTITHSLKIWGIANLVILFFNYAAKGQITIAELDRLPDLKKNGVYVALPAMGADKVKEIIQKNWTVCKCTFIKIEDINKYLASDKFFLTIAGDGDKSKSGSTSSSNYHISFELWTPTASYINSSRKKQPNTADKMVMASFKLYADPETLYHPDNVYKPGFDPAKHIFNWGTGYLKNYITLFMKYINSGTDIRIGSDMFGNKGNHIMDQGQLATLKDHPLYLPDYILLHYTVTVLDSKKQDEKELLAKYAFPYKIISNTELNAKILSATEPFYYLMYVKDDSNNKYINIINAQTGEIVYSESESQSYNLKVKDFAKIAEAIQ